MRNICIGRALDTPAGKRDAHHASQLSCDRKKGPQRIIEGALKFEWLDRLFPYPADSDKAFRNSKQSNCDFLKGRREG